MEKTLSLGAFEELAENEIMETEGGISIVVAGLVIAAAAVPVFVDINCAVRGAMNKAVGVINIISDAFAPAGMPNPNHIWTVY